MGGLGKVPNLKTCQNAEMGTSWIGRLVYSTYSDISECSNGYKLLREGERLKMVDECNKVGDRTDVG